MPVMLICSLYSETDITIIPSVKLCSCQVEDQGSTATFLPYLAEVVGDLSVNNL